MTNSAYPDGCTNREIDQIGNPIMGDDIVELNYQLLYVRSEIANFQKEEAKILERIEAIKC
jgi:hypothetical protein